ncbi:MAG TPA: GGDEF domain-containing protein [Elusimicrobiota bacterium]|nr:GGDEF domain-containing protein [Elusimicrobiota bacterium]
MIELAVWPLIPFLAALFGRSAMKPAVLWSVAVGGGCGWLLDGLLRRPSPGVWISSGIAFAVGAAYVIVRGRQTYQLDAKTRTVIEKLKAEQAALEKTHAALRQEYERYEREDDTAFQVYNLAKALTESFSWNTLVNRFSQALQKLAGSTDFLLYLSSDAGELEPKAQNGVWIRDSLPSPPMTQHPQWVPFGAETLLRVPLWQGNELLGLLWVRWAEPSQPPIAEIETIFEYLLIGFKKAKLFARIESLSRLDGLTGVLRRQTFLDHLQVEWNRAKQFKTTFSLMLVDVDHFKRINDTYGHPAGDAVLARMGELLRMGVYETDYVGRYGGEEFGVLLSRTDLAGVRRKAEMLRSRVAAELFPAGWEKISVTISVGLAHFPRDGQTVDGLFAAVDRALYAAKNGGRNRVVDFSEVKG